MKLLRFGPKGQEKPGLVDADGRIRSLEGKVADIDGDTLSDAALAQLRTIDPKSLPLVEGNPRIGACVGNIGKMVCIGLNYADHAAESGMAVPKEPVVFNKWTSAIVGPRSRRGSMRSAIRPPIHVPAAMPASTVPMIEV